VFAWFVGLLRRLVARYMAMLMNAPVPLDHDPSDAEVLMVVGHGKSRMGLRSTLESLEHEFIPLLSPDQRRAYEQLTTNAPWTLKGKAANYILHLAKMIRQKSRISEPRAHLTDGED